MTEVSENVLREAPFEKESVAVVTPLEIFFLLKPQLRQKVSYRVPVMPSVATVMDGLQEGLPVEALDRAQDMLGITREVLAGVLNSSVRTLARRKVLAPVESEKLFRLAELYQRAVEVVGGQEEAKRWFGGPKKALGGRTPLDYMVSDLGAREVENLLGRIEHGVFA